MNEFQKECIHCGNVFKVYFKSDLVQRFCSHECHDKFRLISTEKFWAKVIKTDYCWNYSGYVSNWGYGVVSLGRVNNKKITTTAHRYSWKITNGEIPDGLCVCHHCDNPICVNPSHLFLGTHEDNRSDCVKKGRQAKGCSSGRYTHPEATARGEGHGNSVLSADKVLEMRKIHALGNISIKALGSKFGISSGGAYAVISRRTWAHV